MNFLTTILLLFCVCFFSCLYAQRFSYSFEGETDSASVALIAQEISNIEGVVSVKPRYKQAKKSGEFLIISSTDNEKHNPYPFKPTSVKELILRNGLQPLVFREISSK